MKCFTTCHQHLAIIVEHTMTRERKCYIQSIMYCQSRTVAYKLYIVFRLVGWSAWRFLRAWLAWQSESSVVLPTRLFHYSSISYHMSVSSKFSVVKYMRTGSPPPPAKLSLRSIRGPSRNIEHWTFTHAFGNPCFRRLSSRAFISTLKYRQHQMKCSTSPMSLHSVHN